MKIHWLGLAVALALIVVLARYGGQFGMVAMLLAIPVLAWFASRVIVHGGTCFGDSGGPNFIGKSNVVGGVTSFGMNGNCAGTGGVYRVDRSDDLGWLYTRFGSQL